MGFFCILIRLTSFVLCLLLIQIFTYFYDSFLKAPNWDQGDNNSSLFKETKCTFFLLPSSLSQGSQVSSFTGLSSQIHFYLEISSIKTFKNFKIILPWDKKNQQTKVLPICVKNLCFHPSLEDVIDSVDYLAIGTSTNYLQNS